MSMSAPFEPQIVRHHTDQDEDIDLKDGPVDGPDTLPGNGADDPSDQGTIQEHESTKEIPLRRPVAGAHLTVDELKEDLGE